MQLTIPSAIPATSIQRLLGRSNLGLNLIASGANQLLAPLPALGNNLRPLLDGLSRNLLLPVAFEASLF
jgi:hypothetical protein